MQGKRKEKNRDEDLLQKQDDFYLSWSQSQKTFELKRLTDYDTPLLPGFAEIKVTHISSAFGQIEKILEEIMKYEPKQNLKCIIGNITMVDEGMFEFEVGDEVIALVTSKWVRSRMRVPVEQVYKKPLFLSKEEAAVTSGILNHFTLRALTITMKIKV